MSASPWARLGESLGNAYILYAIFGLVIGCMGPHLVLLVGYRWSITRGPGRWFHVAVELVYGLLNPVLYLLIFDPALFRSVSSGWLRALGWCFLLGYWSLRLIGPLLPIQREALRAPVRYLLTACIALVLAHGLRDIVASLNPGSWTNNPLAVLMAIPLYLVPLVIAERQRWRTHAPETWAEAGAFFLPTPLGRVATALGALAVVLMCVAAFWRPSERETREQLLAHRDDILSASARAHVDPRLVASILFVTHREHTTPFRSALEEMAAAAWLLDPTSNVLIAQVLDPSLGLAQIKPKTMLTALWILHASLGSPWMPSKEYRDVRNEGTAWSRIPSPGLGKVQLPVLPSVASKKEVVQALLEPQHGIALCAFLLDLYATQWEASNPDWGIRHRPDILATLYQIGFEHSYPKPDPRPNAFGQRVQEVFDEPWMREHFGPTSQPAELTPAP